MMPELNAWYKVARPLSACDRDHVLSASRLELQMEGAFISPRGEQLFFPQLRLCGMKAPYGFVIRQYGRVCVWLAEGMTT